MIREEKRETDRRGDGGMADRERREREREDIEEREIHREGETETEKTDIYDIYSREREIRDNKRRQTRRRYIE